MIEFDGEAQDPFIDESLRKYEQECWHAESQEDEILEKFQNLGRIPSYEALSLIDAIKAIAEDERAIIFEVILDPIKEDIRKETVIATLTAIRSSTNPHLSIDCLKIATGLAVQEGKRGADYARSLGVGRATVSKEVNLLRKKLHLGKSIDTRSEEYSEISRLRELDTNQKVKQKLRLALNPPTQPYNNDNDRNCAPRT
jgi:biotin operon repressor